MDTSEEIIVQTKIHCNLSKVDTLPTMYTQETTIIEICQGYKFENHPQAVCINSVRTG